MTPVANACLEPTSTAWIGNRWKPGTAYTAYTKLIQSGTGLNNVEHLQALCSVKGSCG